MIKTKLTQVIDVSDWDDLVSTTYGKPYSFQQQEGCKERQRVRIRVPVDYPEDFDNTGIPFEVNGREMGVSFETWLNTSPEETNKNFNINYPWENVLFWYRNFYPHEDMIINDLNSRGLLPDGEYSIDIDW